MALSFIHPFTCIVAGQSGCGKTEFTIKLIKNAKELISPEVKRFIWCYGIFQDRFAEINEIQFHEGVPNIQTFEDKEPTLLILDDLM